MINLVAPNIETKQSTDPGWSATRYGWSPGQDIDVKDYQCGHRVIRQGELLRFDDYTYRTRNQDISNGASEYADVKNTAFEIEHTLSQAYGDRGLVFFTALVGKPEDYAENIAGAILGGLSGLEVEDAGGGSRPLPLSKLKEYFERAIFQGYVRSQSQYFDSDSRSDIQAVANQMLLAIGQAFAYQNKELDVREREVEEARAGRGGVSHFDEIHKHFYRQTGRKMPAETETGTIAEIGRTIAQAVAGSHSEAGGESAAVKAVLELVKEEREARRRLEEKIEKLTAPAKQKAKSNQTKAQTAEVV